MTVPPSRGASRPLRWRRRPPPPPAAASRHGEQGLLHRVVPPALSRAGAVAEELRAAPAPPALPLALRAGLLVAGAALLAAGVGATLWTGLGPGPLDVLIAALVEALDASFAAVVWGVTVALVAVAVALGGRPGPGTLVAPFLVGPALDVVTAALDGVPPPTGAGAVVVHLAGVLLIGAGAGALITSGLGAGTGELVATAASRAVGRPEPLVRFGFELSFLALGAALRGPIGLGTVLVGVAIGPAVRGGHRATTAAALALGRARSRAAATVDHRT